MAAIRHGIYEHASATSRPRAKKRGACGASTYTHTFGDVQLGESSTHFTQPQHCRLQLMEQDFVHGEISHKLTKQAPTGIAEDLSQVRIVTPEPKEKLAEPPVAVGTQKVDPRKHGGFAAHSSDNPSVHAKHLLYPQRTFRWLEALAAHASVGCYHFRARTPRYCGAKKAQTLSSLSATLDVKSNQEPTVAESFQFQEVQEVQDDKLPDFHSQYGGMQKHPTNRVAPLGRPSSTPRVALSTPRLAPSTAGQSKWRVKGNLAMSY
eukprot:gnl/MRDRNA2_/MRDRNA2_133701_c0_seq1.p1 gnl/MRDRNA2_/MRDRNA2_133701_c0~~gnl/MRDRNA2_/MRDRNA2_133701_c0_seq1.p1  ORF type:complete len:264 (-),score=37.73 gnl/MRDRNA2_/MRDRNA2_133701_c0_seq1:32-823(-)